MGKAFYTPSQLPTSKRPLGNVPLCGKCGLYRTCTSPKMKVSGKGLRSILIVAEAPGKMEDEKGIQLIGAAGQRLRSELQFLGVDLDRDCWKTNAILCRPPGNKTPDDNHIQCCRCNLFQTIKEKDPKVIILLGSSALRSLIGAVWKESLGKMSTWAGFIIPCREPNAWIVPTYHPSFVLREERNKGLAVWFRKHLKAAIKKAEQPRPWKILPNYKKEIRIIFDPRRAASILNRWKIHGGDIAFDYETTCLKPEYHGAKIVCCAVCWEGRKTIAFPWTNEVIPAMKELLQSNCGKIAANLKFEDRWTQKILNIQIKNWKWDTMLSAHVLNNQRGVTSLKFQAFVQLGCPQYDEHIKPHLEDAGKTKLNRILQLDLRDLLFYNGMDALLEYQLAEKQMRVIRKLKIGIQHV